MEDTLSQSIIEEFIDFSSNRHIKCKPPKEAYYFFPKGNDLIVWDPKNPKKTMRRIFEGGTELNEFEKAVINEFHLEFDKYNKKSYKIVVFPDDWEQANTLRYIQGSGYNLPKAIENLRAHLIWRNETLPIQITNRIIEILNSGFIYGHGRDTNYRPIFIINARVFKENLANYSVGEWINSLVFFIEYTIANLCIPGQVENWNIIMDVSDFSMVFIPSQLKTIFNSLMNNYRCRLYVMYIVNVSPVLSFLWNTIKGVLDPNTENKIKLLKNGENKNILQFINPEQLERRFGGKAPNVERHYFPHIIPSENYSIDNDPLDKLMSPDAYLEFIKKNNKYVMSPYVDFTKTMRSRYSDYVNEEESIYEDAKSLTYTIMLNLNKSSRTMKTIYEDCEEKLDEIKRNFMSNDIIYEIHQGK